MSSTHAQIITGKPWLIDDIQAVCKTSVERVTAMNRTGISAAEFTIGQARKFTTAQKRLNDAFSSVSECVERLSRLNSIATSHLAEIEQSLCGNVRPVQTSKPPPPQRPKIAIPDGLAMMLVQARETLKPLARSTSSESLTALDFLRTDLQLWATSDSSQITLQLPKDHQETVPVASARIVALGSSPPSSVTALDEGLAAKWNTFIVNDAYKEHADIGWAGSTEWLQLLSPINFGDQLVRRPDLSTTFDSTAISPFHFDIVASSPAPRLGTGFCITGSIPDITVDDKVLFSVRSEFVQPRMYEPSEGFAQHMHLINNPRLISALSYYLEPLEMEYIQKIEEEERKRKEQEALADLEQLKALQHPVVIPTVVESVASSVPLSLDPVATLYAALKPGVSVTVTRVVQPENSQQFWKTDDLILTDPLAQVRTLDTTQPISQATRRVLSIEAFKRQKGFCYGCGSRLDLDLSPPHLDHYTGFVFCSHCHSEQCTFIPVLTTKFCFREEPVADDIREFLISKSTEPLIPITDVDAAFQRRNRKGKKTLRLRKQLADSAVYVETCPQKENLKLEMSSSVPHWITRENCDYVSVEELKMWATDRDPSLRYLAALDVLERHSAVCRACQARAHICEVCKRPIYPFTLGMRSCHDCHSLFHSECWKRIRGLECPFCARRSRFSSSSRQLAIPSS